MREELENRSNDNIDKFFTGENMVMDDRGGSFVAVRRISHGLERANGNSTCHSTSGIFLSLFLFFWDSWSSKIKYQQ